MAEEAKPPRGAESGTSADVSPGTALPPAHHDLSTQPLNRRTGGPRCHHRSGRARSNKIPPCRLPGAVYKTAMRLLPALCLLALTAGLAIGADTARLVADLMQSEQELGSVPFAEVVHAATGRKVLPLQPTNAVNREILARIAQALDTVLPQLNANNSPARQKRRINEVSALFENALKDALNAVGGFDCDFPKLASGARQRSGYPDLRLVDQASGRVLYLDPKLFERSSRASTLRTFYFEPKRETNKILDDAHHLIVGFEHDGAAGAWTFLGWELVDLANFRVKLKAEFQGSNRDLYKPEAVLLRSATNALPKAR